MKQVAYLLPSFPELAQTFVLGEIAELEQLGVPLTIFSLRLPRTRRTQAEAGNLKSSVCYCPAAWSLPVVKACLKFLLVRPGLALALVWDLVRGAKHRFCSEAATGEGIKANMSLYEKVRGQFHTNGFFILLKSILFMPSAVYLADLMTRQGISRLHAHWASHPSTVALLISKITGIEFTFTAHAYDIYMVDFMLREKIAGATRVVTCAEVNRRFLERNAGAVAVDKIAVCYHGVDLDRFTPGPPRIPSGTSLLVGCGNLEAYKGFEYLIQACKLLKEQGVSFRCKIIGDGPRRSALEQLRDSMGLADEVDLPGAVTHDELLPQLGAADICVMPSVLLQGYGKRDVIPNIVVEATAMGVPVIASDVGGMSEAVKHGINGYLVPQADAQALASAIAKLLKDPQERRRMGKAGARQARSLFDRRANAERLVQLLGLELEKRPSRNATEDSLNRGARQ